MIYDSLKSISRYRGIYPNLDIAIDYIEQTDLQTLPNGKTIIKEDEVYINVVESTLADYETFPYELHNEYLDLHVDITGSEYIYFSSCESLSVTQEYDNKNDYALGEGEVVARCVVDSNHFCICMLQEPHKPCVSIDDGCLIRKAIFKIKV